MELEKVMKERYSVRSFKKEKIEKEKIEELLKVLDQVPTATNAQPVQIYVLETTESLNKIEQLARTYQSPLVLLIASNEDESWHNPKEEGYNTSEMDGSITCTYLMLKAWELGIGSVWIRYFNKYEVKKTFNLSENIKPICLLALGYPSDDSNPSQSHFQKKPLEELIKYL